MNLWITPVWAVYCLVIAGLLGACLGSFLHCAAWRHSRGQSVVRGRSHCPDCGHELTPLELIPVFSFLFQRGRCRSCGKKLSWRYPASELLLAAIFVSVVWRFGLTPEALQWLGFGCALFYLAFVDAETMELPGIPMIASLVWFLALTPFFPEPLERLKLGAVSGLAFGAALLLIALAMDYILKKESLGGGDIKLLALTGLYFGWAGNLLLLIVACVLGLVMAAAFRKKEAFPFGPAIALAAWPTALFGNQIIEWYMGLF